MVYLPFLDTFPNTVLIGGNTNAQIGKDENDKFCLHSLPNRNGECLADFSLEYSLAYQKPNLKKEGKENNWPTPNQITLKHS